MRNSFRSSNYTLRIDSKNKNALGRDFHSDGAHEIPQEHKCSRLQKYTHFAEPHTDTFSSTAMD